MKAENDGRDHKHEPPADPLRRTKHPFRPLQASERGRRVRPLQPLAAPPRVRRLTKGAPSSSRPPSTTRQPASDAAAAAAARPRAEARRVEGRDAEPRGPRADADGRPLRREAADERDVRVAAHDGPALADGAEVAVRAGDVVRRRPDLCGNPRKLRLLDGLTHWDFHDGQDLGRGRHGAGAGLERPCARWRRSRGDGVLVG